jgi:hypothetical protein
MMLMNHTLKITPAYFDAVASGQKTLEIRREDDQTFAAGDVLTLQEWDFHRLPTRQQAYYRLLHDLPISPPPSWGEQERTAYQQPLMQGYTGRGCRVRVTHVLREPPFVPQGYAALSLRLLSQAPAAIPTPGGVLTVQGEDDPDPEQYPGYAIAVDGEIAAIVEWHPDYQAVVVRTYTMRDDLESQAYHRWDTGEILPELE